MSPATHMTGAPPPDWVLIAAGALVSIAVLIAVTWVALTTPVPQDPEDPDAD